ncbi:MAG: cobalt-precorrin 5A hydrolase [Oscillospiraceae bacterium]|nr:cobalt-precorrin 5A hydrolase [Oscillospiraceae bacterium]
MRAALISVTERGAELSAKIADLRVCDCLRYAHESHVDALAVPFSSVLEVTSKVWDSFDALVFLCAAGIAVRAIAPHIRDKSQDPAVLVIDECGKFVIPILSGHIGGANALAQQIAEKMHATPVLTTATDVGRRFSPDSFAVANGLYIEDLSAAKDVAAAVLAGETVGLVSDHPFRNLPPELEEDSGGRIGIYIGNRDLKPFLTTLHLLPRDLVVGIGCRRGASAEQIEALLVKAGIPLQRVWKVATIDRKAREEGILAFCRKHRLPLVTYAAEELQGVPGSFATSAFVRQTVGVDNVCERSAVLCAGGELIVPKTAQNGVTCAAARREISLDFAKRRDLA